MIKVKLHPLTEEELNPYIINLNDLDNKLSFQAIFNNDNPVHLEIGCGNGHFLLERSQNHPNINFIGIDISTKRVTKSAIKIAKRTIKNVRFVWGDGKALLKDHIHINSIETCYLNFPDPWPKRRHRKHRIVNEEFLDLLHNILKKNGFFYAVTDDKDYFSTILGRFKEDTRFINSFSEDYLHFLEDYEISLYEEKWRNLEREIHYMRYYKK